MIFITGDTHGGIDVKKLTTANFPTGKELTKDDYVIIAGDFGFIWDGSKEQWYWLNWLKDKPWTTLFIDGNHENFDMLNVYPVEQWNGGNVHKINDSVIHLMRGQVFTLQGLKFFTFGGGLSIDKQYRTEGKSWWSQEIPTREEVDIGLNNLQQHDFTVDYIITHTAPTWVCSMLNQYKVDDPTCQYMDCFDKFVKFKKWYFGHFHTSRAIDNEFIALYNEIVRIA